MDVGQTLDWSLDATALLAHHLQGSLRILQLGCGQGQLALRLTELGHAVTALDLSPTAISQARKAASKLIQPPTFIRADISAPLPFDDEAFDAVLAVLSLHYFTPELTAAVFREIKRVLAPRGWFCFYVNSEAEGQSRIDKAEVCSTLAPSVFHESDGMTRRYFSAADLSDLLHGWEVHVCEHIEIASLDRAKACWRVLVSRDRLTHRDEQIGQIDPAVDVLIRARADDSGADRG